MAFNPGTVGYEPIFKCRLDPTRHRERLVISASGLIGSIATGKIFWFAWVDLASGYAWREQKAEAEAASRTSFAASSTGAIGQRRRALDRRLEGGLDLRVQRLDGRHAVQSVGDDAGSTEEFEL